MSYVTCHKSPEGGPNRFFAKTLLKSCFVHIEHCVICHMSEVTSVNVNLNTCAKCRRAEDASCI